MIAEIVTVVGLGCCSAVVVVVVVVAGSAAVAYCNMAFAGIDLSCWLLHFVAVIGSVDRAGRMWTQMWWLEWTRRLLPVGAS